MNILFTCAGRRNYLINYFKEALNGDGKVFAADMQKTAPALVDADIAIVVSSIYDKDYIKELLQICKKNKINALISLNDLELPLLSENVEAFEEIGVKLIISNKKVIDICFDKFKTHKFIQDIGLKSPITIVEPSIAIEAINNKLINFPLVLKPRWGSASIGIYFPENMEQYELMERLAILQINESILVRANNKDIGNGLLYQQRIAGEEFGLDIINDLQGNYVTTIVKKKLAMRAGETDKAIVIKNKHISFIGKTIGENLKHIGNLDCDVLYDGKEYYVLELNPRFGGGFPFSYEAGVNLPEAILNWMKGESIDLDVLTPQINIAFAKCDRLIKVIL